jgi:hypothetical protein
MKDNGLGPRIVLRYGSYSYRFGEAAPIDGLAPRTGFTYSVIQPRSYRAKDSPSRDAHPRVGEVFFDRGRA